MSSKILSGISIRFIPVGVLVSIVLFSFSLSVFAFEEWVHYVPHTSQVELSYGEEAGTSYVNVVIEFPSSGYNVSNWGIPRIDGNMISVDAEVWDWTGLDLQVITYVSNDYNLGNLSAGKYLFVFKAWESPVKNFTFIILEEFSYRRIFEEDLVQISDSIEQIVGIEITDYFDFIETAVIEIEYTTELSDPEKISWQDSVEHSLESKWYIKHVSRNMIFTIPEKTPPWPGFAIGELLVRFVETSYFDLNTDGVINMADISIVAMAFGTIPDDLNWNEMTDLDKNGEINIIDVSMVALDYGKTV